MKKSLPRRILIAGAALCFSALAACPAFAANLSGNLDSVDKSQITGWAWNKENPAEPVTVELAFAGADGPGGPATVSVTADQPRSDLKKALDSPNHSFTYNVDWNSFEGDTFTVTAEAVSGDVRTPLGGSFTYQKSNQETEDAKPSFNKKETAEDTPSDTEVSAGGPGFDLGEPDSGNSDGASDEKLKEGDQTGPTTVSTDAPTGRQGNHLGEFTASGYCSCSRCSGGHNLTYSGTVPKPNHTIAADTSVFPIGTKIMINNVVYTVEDIGGSVKGNRLDIFFSSHQEALNFGLKKVQVYAIE